MNQQKELFLTEMNLFKNELLTSPKDSTKSHSQEPNFPATRSNGISAGTTEFQR